MRVEKISYHPAFAKDLKKLDTVDKKRVIEAEQLFRSNPLYPSLRLHQLKGKLAGAWSISVTMKIRMIFVRRDDGEIVFQSVGKHDLYRGL